GDIEPSLRLPIRILRERDSARFGDALESCGNVDAIPHEIAVGLLDDIAQMDADAEFDPSVGWHPCVALDKTGLHLDRAPHRVDGAAELDDAAVSSTLDDATPMGRDRGVDEVAAQAPETRKRAILVRAGEPAVADHVGDQNRREFERLGHESISSHHSMKKVQ